ncbi:MAG: AAA family ATPase [Deltaproteobacteria bacterium]|nr:AAA family ATPase [Deltaproteobacteria bacterium]
MEKTSVIAGNQAAKSANLTVEAVFGIPSKMPVVGFEAGHPLTPIKIGYVWDTKNVRDLLEWMSEPSPDPLWITGPTGCGKTEMAVQLGAGLNAPTIIVTGRKDAEPGEVLGRIWLENGSTVFKPGLLIEAYEKGWLIIFDEIDGFCPEVGVCLHRLLEKKPVTLDNGYVAHPHTRTLMIATANTRGDGEGGDIYASTNIFNLATLNRFEKWEMNYPPSDVEEEIIKSHLGSLDDRAIASMVKVAADIRVAYDQGHCPGPISIRDLIRWGRKLMLCGHRTDVKPIYHSFDKAFGNGVNRHVRAALHKFVQTHFNVPAPTI